MKYFKLIALFLGFSLSTYSQVTIGFATKEVEVNSSFQLDLNLSNQEEVRAIQFDFSWNQTGFQYSDQVLKSERLSSNHSISLSLVSEQENRYRILVFSPDNTPISIGEGPILSLVMSATIQQGIYPISISNMVLSDSQSANITDLSIADASVTVLAPALVGFSNQLDFGSVYKETYVEQSLQFQNQGTAPLKIELIEDRSTDFVIDTSLFPLTVAPGSSKSIAVGFESASSGSFDEYITIQTNDPLIPEAIQVNFKAQVYSDNTAFMVPLTMDSGAEDWFNFAIDTQEFITSFQFDLIIPDEFVVDATAVELLSNNSTHSISSSFNETTRILRVLSFSQTNAPYDLKQGNLVRIRIRSQENLEPKTYSFTLQDVVLNNLELFNVTTNAFGADVTISGAKLSVDSNLTLEPLPYDFVTNASFVVRNDGTELLTVTELSSSSNAVSFEDLASFELGVNQERTISFNVKPDRVPDFDFELYLDHDSYSQRDTIAVTSSVFYPNFVQIKSLVLPKGGSGILPIQLINYEGVKGFEFNMVLDPGFELAIENAMLVGSFSEGYSLSVVPNQQPNSFKVLVYNSANKIIDPGTHDLIEIPIQTGSVNSGSYDVSFSDLIISSEANLNIASAAVTANQISVSLVSVSNDMSIEVDEQIAQSFQFDVLNEGGLPLSYEIVTPPTNGTLTISGTSFIYQSNSDSAVSDSFQYLSDDGIFKSEIATVQITINPINDPPLFEPLGDLAFSEATEVGTKLFELKAIDPDTDASSLVFSFGNTTAVDFLEIKNNSEVYLSAELDYEQIQSYEIYFEVSDGIATSALSQTIQVLDVPNSFIEKAFLIEVYDVLLEDTTAKVDYSKYMNQEALEGQTVIFELSGGVDRDVFTINSQTGALNFKEIPDYENPIDADKNNIYEVTVKLTNINDGEAKTPVLLTPTSFSVPEANPIVFEQIETFVVAADEDTDGDGISDVNDNCPLTANSDQLDSDGDGIGDICDDSDQDGIVDLYDSCPNSQIGVYIDTTGCELFTLNQDNYSIEITSATCVGSSNGSLSVVVSNQNYTYVMSISGQASQTISADNNHSIEVSGLDAGSYDLCFTVEGQEAYQQCFTVLIGEPNALSAKTSVNYSNRSLNLDLAGAETYVINLNGKSFKSTNSSLQLELKPGLNTIEVATDLTCQGIYFEEIFVSEKVLAYPNPTSNWVQLYVGGADRQITLGLYSLEGTFLTSKTLEVSANRVIELDLSAYHTGVYILQLNGNTVQKSIKIIKE